MYRRFGSEVTIVEMGPRLIQREDEDVSAAIQEILEARRNSRPAECQVHRLSQAAATRSWRTWIATTGPEVDGSHVLLAVGRRPTPTTWVWTRPA